MCDAMLHKNNISSVSGSVLLVNLFKSETPELQYPKLVLCAMRDILLCAGV